MLRLLGILLLLVVRTGLAQPLPALEIGSLEHTLLRAPVEYLQTAQPLTLESLLEQGRDAGFRPLTPSALNQGVTDASYWLRVRLENTGPRDKTWVLAHETTYLDSLTIYAADAGSGYRRIALSDRQPFDSRPIEYRKLAWRHTTPAGSHTDLYLRMEYLQGHADAMSLNVHLWDEAAFQARRADENLLLGIYNGNALGLLVISLVLALAMRRAVYVFYGLFVAGTALFWLQMNGLAFQYLWPDWVFMHNEGFHLIFLLFAVLALQFSRAFLATPRIMPRIDRCIQGLLGLAAAVLLLRLAGVYEPVLYIAAAYLSLLSLLPVLGWIAYRRGVRHAGWYCAAWLIYAASLVVSVLSAYTPWMRWGMEPLLFTQLGSVVENLLLLFASAKRVIQMDQERRQALALANTDPLTGLGNRRLLSQRYKQLKHAFSFDRQPVYLILLDIDRFKEINDSLGHEAGDNVLVDLAALLRDNSRDGDVCIRLGGEEFALLVKTEDLEAARRIVERIREEFADSPTHHQDQQIQHTLSAGLVRVFAGDVQLSEREMLQLADAALYEAKASGRNRVAVHVPRNELSAVV